MPTTLRAQAAQCIMVRLGSHLPPVATAEEDVARLRDMLDALPLGGVILFRAQSPAVADALTTLHKCAASPLLVAADIERGVGQQVEGATRFPHAQALAETPNPEVAVRVLAEATAREARACGIHLAFAPVADVNTRADNPIIGTRAFGEAPDAVSRCVRAYIQAARAEGMATTAKHFPGHGRTAADSHATLPTVDADADALEAVDLPPFQAAFEADVDAVMTAHVAYPALGDEGPATASRRLLHDRLRTQMGFDGLVVSDSLRMEGIQSAGVRPSSLLEAGVDLLLDPVDAVAVVDDLVRAVREGALAEERLQEACRRVLALKRQMHDRWGDGAFAPTGSQNAVGTADHRAAAERLAQDAVAVAVPDASPWPLPPDAVRNGADLMVVRLTSRAAAPSSPLEHALRFTYPSVLYRTVDPNTSAVERAAIRDLGQTRKHLVVAIAAEPAAWHAFGLAPEQRTLLRELAATRSVAYALLGSPNVIEVPPGAATICTYSDVPASQRALVRLMSSRTL
jgi:beta-glucosidase-like glycosyl hydrolase